MNSFRFPTKFELRLRKGNISRGNYLKTETNNILFIIYFSYIITPKSKKSEVADSSHQEEKSVWYDMKVVLNDPSRQCNINVSCLQFNLKSVYVEKMIKILIGFFFDYVIDKSIRIKPPFSSTPQKISD